MKLYADLIIDSRLTRVYISDVQVSEYHKQGVRREPSRKCVSTLEALVSALNIVEPCKESEIAGCVMLDGFKQMLKYQKEFMKNGKNMRSRDIADGTGNSNDDNSDLNSNGNCHSISNSELDVDVDIDIHDEDTSCEMIEAEHHKYACLGRKGVHFTLCRQERQMDGTIGTTAMGDVYHDTYDNVSSKCQLINKNENRTRGYRLSVLSAIPLYNNNWAELNDSDDIMSHNGLQAGIAMHCEVCRKENQVRMYHQ